MMDGKERKTNVSGPEPGQDNFNVKPLLDWFRKDWFIIAVCLVSILICMVAYLNTSEVIKEVSNNCAVYIEDNCRGINIPGGVPFNAGANVSGFQLLERETWKKDPEPWEIENGIKE